MKTLLLLCGLLLYACNPTLNSPQMVETITIDEGRWTLEWSDEFDGPAGQAPDPNKWNYEVGGHGFGNNQLEFNTDSPDNAMLDGDGHLVITARRQQYLGKAFTSARLNTKGKFESTYGRYEFRAKMPSGAGLWPALWLLGADYETNTWPACGEIDVMEMRGQKPGEVLSSLHGPGYSAGASKTKSLDVTPTLDETFHIYTMIWTPDEISWLIDNQLYHRQSKNGFNENQPWVFDHPFFILVNLAVGGQFVGLVPDSTRFPAQMYLDYVRVYRATGDE